MSAGKFSSNMISFHDGRQEDQDLQVHSAADLLIHLHCKQGSTAA